MEISIPFFITKYLFNGVNLVYDYETLRIQMTRSDVESLGGMNTSVYRIQMKGNVIIRRVQ